jgi:hypothetical protein
VYISTSTPTFHLHGVVLKHSENFPQAPLAAVSREKAQLSVLLIRAVTVHLRVVNENHNAHQIVLQQIMARSFTLQPSLTHDRPYSHYANRSGKTETTCAYLCIKQDNKATDYGLQGRDYIPGWKVIFLPFVTIASRPPLRPTHLRIECVQRFLSLWVKRTELEADKSPPSISEFYST